MELKMTLLSRKRIFRAVSLVKDLRENGVGYEQTKEDGVIRIRMLVKKCDLEKLIYKGDNRVGYGDVLRPSLVEQRLRQLRRKHHAKVVEKKRPSCWTPALGSIPEEF